MLKELIKIANELDDRGLLRLAGQLDNIILKFAEDDADEFESGVALEALQADEAVESEASSIVADAIDRSAEMRHFKNTFLTRNPGGEAEGSTFFEPQDIESLKAAVWTPYPHPEIAGDAQGYKADIPGTFGLIKLEDLEPDTPIKMVLGHKGETPFVTVLVDNADVPSDLARSEFTTILLGPGEDGLIVYTFHPGPPIAPSIMTPSAETEAAKVAADAMAIGFDYAKAAAL